MGQKQRERKLIQGLQPRRLESGLGPEYGSFVENEQGGTTEMMS